MARRPLRIILCGLGHMGGWYLQAIRARGECALAAVVDPDVAARRQRLRTAGLDEAIGHATLAEALSAVDADAIIDASPPLQREGNGMLAAAAGMHILAEKPLGTTQGAAERLVAAAERAGVVLMVAQQRRHTPLIQTLRAHAAGHSGLRQVFLSFHHHVTRDSWRDRMEHPLLIEMAGHHFDMLRCVLGVEPVSVQGMSWNPPGGRFAHDAACALLFRYPGGRTATYLANWVATDAAKTSNECDWRIEFTEHVLVARDDAVWSVPRGGEPSRIDAVAMATQGHERIFQEFLRAASTGTAAVETSGRDNLGTVAMVHAAIAAVASGRAVAIAPSGAGELAHESGPRVPVAAAIHPG